MHIISSYLKKNLKSLIKFHRIHVRSTIVIRIHSYDRSSWDLRQLTIVILSGWNKKLSIKYNKKCFLGKNTSNKLGLIVKSTLQKIKLHTLVTALISHWFCVLWEPFELVPLRTKFSDEKALLQIPRRWDLPYRKKKKNFSQKF